MFRFVAFLLDFFMEFCLLKSVCTLYTLSTISVSLLVIVIFNSQTSVSTSAMSLLLTMGVDSCFFVYLIMSAVSMAVEST